MSSSSNQSETMYETVVNQEGQYAIWPVSKVMPDGWSKAGRQGTKESCLGFIGEVWADMRPISLRAQGKPA